jgi:3-polyprenyl-4-hydroxybenzoate decarboxylase
MAYRDLHEFIARLEKNHRLKRITAPVSQDLEITEIANRVMKGAREHNVALLFENVRGQRCRSSSACLVRKNEWRGRSAWNDWLTSPRNCPSLFHSICRAVSSPKRSVAGRCWRACAIPNRASSVAARARKW